MAKDEAYQQAEQKIQQALKSGATELDLRNMELTELPESIGQLTQLTELNLSRNQLTVLPPSLGQLTQLTTLNLSNNQLTTLPDSLGQLAQLTELNLSDNQLTTLPDWLGQLTQLTELNLSNNQLTALPDSLGQLTQLQTLNLEHNQLKELSESLGRLSQLREINLIGNPLGVLPDVLRKLIRLEELNIALTKLKKLPEWVSEYQSLVYLNILNNEISELPQTLGELQNLEKLALGFGAGGNPLGKIPPVLRSLKKLNKLWARNCNIELLPEWISEFKNLTTLDLANNLITNIPSSLIQVEHLAELNLKDNPLNPALQSAYKQGLPALIAYLRSLAENAEPLYEAKLVLVGEGNVGKTTLLKALKGKAGAAPQEHEPTTHGVEIDIHGLRLPHPTQDGVEIQLNAWDFGGQDVYRVTHQFFFSRRSLYLLVWEPRRGVQQGQVEDWLNMIRLRVGDDACVIIVSTHCKTGERIARIDQPVFKGQYGDMIVGFHEVDSLVPDEATGEMVGIAALKKVIAEQASKLEQMGMGFNRDWKAARDELLQRPEPRVAYSVFREVCAKYKLSEIDTSTLARLMHDLGYIVHYSDDEKLRDDVILKPEWLTKAIGFILEDRATQDAEGILPDARLTQVWRDHPFKDEPRYDPALYPFFLRLMEKYDVSYRLPEGDASLVSQHVPQVRPNLPWLPEQEPPENLRRIAMICALDEDPPGLVPWMIVRTHDYAVEQKNASGSIHRLHWDKGMFLRYSTHGEAMLEKRGREFHVYAQGDWPQYFMTILQHTLEKLITDNWRGMEGRYRFTIPCPGRKDDKPCVGRFNVNALQEFLAKGAQVFPCQECFGMYSISELLMGFEERPMEVLLREINAKLDGLDSRVANYFMALMNAIADEAKNGPRLFTFRSRDAGLSPKQLFARPLDLQLWCEAEGCQHPVIAKDKGFYSIDQPLEWVTKLAPYANFALKVLATVAPIAAPAINTFFGPKTTETWKIADQLSLASAIAGKLPSEIKASEHSMSPGKMLSEPERSGILALHRLLNELDPAQGKLGLHRVAPTTPEQ